MTITLDTIEKIISIVGNSIVIIGGAISFIRYSTNLSQAIKEIKKKNNLTSLAKSCLLPMAVTAFLLLTLVMQALSPNPIDRLSIISISSCISAISFMLVVISYKYTLWKTCRAFDDGIEI